MAILTQALFWETRNSKYTKECIYTVKYKDRLHNNKTYKSLYQLYMQYLDPTEYQFVMEVFAGNFKQWEAIQASKTLKDMGLDTARWNEDLIRKIKSLAIGVVMQDVNDTESKTSPSSAKWIAEAKYNGTTTENAKNILKKAKKAQHTQTSDADTEDDIARLGIRH